MEKTAVHNLSSRGDERTHSNCDNKFHRYLHKICVIKSNHFTAFFESRGCESPFNGSWANVRSLTRKKVVMRLINTTPALKPAFITFSGVSREFQEARLLLLFKEPEFHEIIR